LIEAAKLYTKIPAAPRAPFNAFQRLDDGSEGWKQAFGKGYEDWLDKTELEDLKILFQNPLSRRFDWQACS
jgi:hypothetical protein